MATIYFNGVEIELPKKTMAIAKKEDLMHKAQTREEAYRRQYDYAKGILGSQFIEVFESEDINEIDLVDLTCICNAIQEGFKQKLYEQQKQQANEAANNAAIDKIIKVGESIAKIDDTASKYHK